MVIKSFLLMHLIISSLKNHNLGLMLSPFPHLIVIRIPRRYPPSSVRNDHNHGLIPPFILSFLVKYFLLPPRLVVDLRTFNTISYIARRVPVLYMFNTFNVIRPSLCHWLHLSIMPESRNRSLFPIHIHNIHNIHIFLTKFGTFRRNIE
ncbi:hypothetical protein LENED_005438 [Lentinula edodes]|uniref:Uncharacterized protein n=1 Tax=Lentinula edodes TaxID=5353 RepID=A0A1Q3E943_LENED|nr:hypothetical protein LENED_005438 [Lentinula edodes]